jgi:tRNA A-37 threonylcarbamoyl transferase component Bud32
MTVFEFWPDLDQAWQAIPDLSTQPSLETATGGRYRVLKTESRARVILLGAEGHAPLVLKIYRTPSRLAWRTFGLASRGNREFTVMMNSHRLGLPVARPRYWLERRIRGCVEYSALALDVIDGPDLESWLLDERCGPDQRRQAAATAGDLLGRFHRAGLFWGTVTPRNLLLPDGDAGRILAIDMPYARLHNKDITGNVHAMMDLALVLSLSDGQPAFDNREREALVLAYCAGDRDRARAIDNALHTPSHREWKRKRLLRRLGNLFSKGAYSSGRGGVYEDDTGAYRPLSSEAVFSIRLRDNGCLTADP